MKLTLVLGMFPSFMAMTAVFLLMTQFNFIDNHWSLILIYAAGAPMGYMVQKGFLISFLETRLIFFNNNPITNNLITFSAGSHVSSL